MEHIGYILGKNIQLPNYLGMMVEGEDLTEIITLKMRRDETLEELEYYLTYRNANGAGDTIALTKEITDKEILLSFTVTDAFTAVKGKMEIQVTGFAIGDEPGTDDPVWKSFVSTISIARALHPEEIQPETPTVFVQYLSQMQELKEAAKTAKDAAEDAQEAAETAQGKAEDAQEAAEDAAENAATSAETATTKAGEANRSAQSAYTSATTATQKASEAGGSAQSAASSASAAHDSETNAKTSEDNAKESDDKSEESALKSEGYSVGTQNGQEVPESSEYFENNAKYYKERTEELASNFVKYDDSELTPTLPINADQLNGHTDSYFATASELETERQTRANADLALSEAISREAELRQNADNILSNAIKNEERERENEVSRLEENIGTEANSRLRADEALEERVRALEALSRSAIYYFEEE